jgi:hypothetical protein
VVNRHIFLLLSDEAFHFLAMHQTSCGVFKSFTLYTDFFLDLNCYRLQRQNVPENLVGAFKGAVMPHEQGAALNKILEEVRLQLLLTLHTFFLSGNLVPEHGQDHNVLVGFCATKLSKHSQVAARLATEPSIGYPRNR